MWVYRDGKVIYGEKVKLKSFNQYRTELEIIHKFHNRMKTIFLLKTLFKVEAAKKRRNCTMCDAMSNA